MDFSQITIELLKGMGTSLLIFAVTIVCSLPLGLFVSFGRMSKNVVLRTITKVYISIMRGTPLMLQLMVVLYGPPFLLGVKMTPEYRMLSVFIGFTINYAAYFAEIYRAGIESIPVGQYEASKVLGYSRSQRFMKIILPQVVRHILPPVTNETITLVKDTSLAFVIGVSEMFTNAKEIVASQGTLLPFIIAAVFYYVMNLVVAVIMEAIEKKLNYY